MHSSNILLDGCQPCLGVFIQCDQPRFAIGCSVQWAVIDDMATVCIRCPQSQAALSLSPHSRIIAAKHPTSLLSRLRSVPCFRGRLVSMMLSGSSTKQCNWQWSVFCHLPPSAAWATGVWICLLDGCWELVACSTNGLLDFR